MSNFFALVHNILSNILEYHLFFKIRFLIVPFPKNFLLKPKSKPKKFQLEQTIVARDDLSSNFSKF